MENNPLNCKLSVNINKIATLRNSRGGHEPSVIDAAKNIINFGAHGVTVHPRPDERHIRKEDVYHLCKLITNHNRSTKSPIEFNVEGYPSEDFLSLLKETKPHQVTLVPDPPDALTSNAGWQFKKNQSFLTKVTREIQNYGSRVSLFLDPFTWSNEEKEALLKIKPDRVELYTEKYASDFNTEKEESTLSVYQKVAHEVSLESIAINAGHDLNLKNIKKLLSAIPELQEVSIGHALICEALYMGLEKTVESYLNEMRK